MVRQEEENSLQKAQALVKAEKEKQQRVHRRFVEEAAKEVRKRRLAGLLQQLEVYEVGKPVRFVKKG